MMNGILKYLIITIIVIGSIHHNCFSQDFFRDYADHLQSLNHRENWTTRDKEKFAKQQTYKLRKVFYKVEHIEKISMLKADTFYMANYLGPNATASRLIWNKTHSCYFEYHFKPQEYKFKDFDLVITPNASKLLAAIDPDLKKLIEQSDTLGFKKYMAMHTSTTGLSFTVAIRKKDHWDFMESPTYIIIIDGQNINRIQYIDKYLCYANYSSQSLLQGN